MDKTSRQNRKIDRRSFLRRPGSVAASLGAGVVASGAALIRRAGEAGGAARADEGRPKTYTDAQGHPCRFCPTCGGHMSSQDHMWHCATCGGSSHE